MLLQVLGHRHWPGQSKPKTPRAPPPILWEYTPIQRAPPLPTTVTPLLVLPKMYTSGVWGSKMHVWHDRQMQRHAHSKMLLTYIVYAGTLQSIQWCQTCWNFFIIYKHHTYLLWWRSHTVLRPCVRHFLARLKSGRCGWWAAETLTVAIQTHAADISRYQPHSAAGLLKYVLALSILDILAGLPSWMTNPYWPLRPLKLSI